MLAIDFAEKAMKISNRIKREDSYSDEIYAHLILPEKNHLYYSRKSSPDIPA